MKIVESMRRPTLLCAALVSLLVAAGCQQPAMVTSNTPDASVPDDSYSEGRHLLFNAANRFEYTTAIERLEDAVATDPDNASARVALAYAYTKQSRYSDMLGHLAAAKANLAVLSDKESLWLDALDARASDEAAREIRSWIAVVKADPEDRWAWYELATARLAVEDFEGSVAAVERALTVEPDPSKWEASWIYYVHSKALFRDGKPALAVDAAEAARSNETTWRSTYYRMALGAAATGNLDPQEFVADYRAISKSENRNSEAMTETNIALYFYELGDYESAVKYARRGLAIAQDAYQSWALGYSLIASGQADEALAVIDSGLQAKPDDVYLFASKGWALYRLGRLQEAKETLEAARAAAPRRVLRVEQDLEVVRDALQDPHAKPAPTIRWLG